MALLKPTKMTCDPGSYDQGRQESIQYIVLQNRPKNQEFSAHYQVEADKIVQFVEDWDRAKHWRTAPYTHPWCNDENAIGVVFDSLEDEALHNGLNLVRWLMDKYDIPDQRVLSWSAFQEQLHDL